jgi:phasin family protein
MAAGSPEDKAARQTELTKEAFKSAIANMRELAEMVAKSQGEAFEVINKRVTDSLDELRDTMAKKVAK